MKWRDLTKKKKAYIYGSIAIIVVLLWAFISAAFITRGLNRDKLHTGKDSQEAFIHGIILTETKDETKYWEIYGETGRYESNKHIAMLNNVVGNIYKGKDVSMSFESSKGVYDSTKKEIRLFEDTFIALSDGTTLKADELVWSGSDKPIIAKGKVEITRGKDFLAQADAIEISPDYSKIKITGHSKSKIYKGGK